MKVKLSGCKVRVKVKLSGNVARNTTTTVLIVLNTSCEFLALCRQEFAIKLGEAFTC